MTNDTDDWFLRGHAAASILFNDLVWAEQTYQMDRGERVRGAYDPPFPAQAVDDLRARQQRMNILEELMAAQGRTEIPPVEQHGAWVEVDDALLLAGCPLDRHGVRWVPATLIAAFRVLYHTPLPSCAVDPRRLDFADHAERRLWVPCRASAKNPPLNPSQERERLPRAKNLP